MKKIILLSSILFITTSCSVDIDKKIEKKDRRNDKDDINVIDKIWKQSLDKSIDMYNTRTYAS